jgi:hypothetical protein
MNNFRVNNFIFEFLLVVLIGVIITYLLTFRILNNFFIGDDFVILKHTLELKDVFSFLTHTWRGYFDYYNWRNYKLGSDLYRPIVNFSFLIDYYLFNLDARGYYLTNIFIYLISGIVVYYIAKIIIKNQLFALAALILFLLHPVHYHPLFYISNRTDSLVGLFLGLSLLSYLNYNKGNRKLYFWLSYIFFILALFTKETAIFFPLVILFYDLLIVKKKNFENFKKFFIFFLTSGLYLLLRIILLGNVGQYGSWGISFKSLYFFISLVKKFGFILILFIFGKAKYTYLGYKFWFLFLIGGISTTYFLYKFLKKTIFRRNIIFWFIISFFLIIGPAFFILSERFLYLAVLFPLLVFLYILKEIMENSPFSKQFVYLSVIFVAILISFWLREWNISVLSVNKASYLSRNFINFLEKNEEIKEGANVLTILPDNINKESCIFLNGQREAYSLFGTKNINIFPLTLVTSNKLTVEGPKLTKKNNTLILELKNEEEFFVFSQLNFNKFKEGDFIENDYSFIKIIKKDKKGNIKTIGVELRHPLSLENSVIVIYSMDHFNMIKYF